MFNVSHYIQTAFANRSNKLTFLHSDTIRPVPHMSGWKFELTNTIDSNDTISRGHFPFQAMRDGTGNVRIRAYDGKFQKKRSYIRIGFEAIEMTEDEIVNVSGNCTIYLHVYRNTDQKKWEYEFLAMSDEPSNSGECDFYTAVAEIEWDGQINCPKYIRQLVWEDITLNPYEEKELIKDVYYDSDASAIVKTTEKVLSMKEDCSEESSSEPQTVIGVASCP